MPGSEADLLRSLPAGAMAELRALSSRQDLDARLKQLGFTKLGQRMRVANALASLALNGEGETGSGTANDGAVLESDPSDDEADGPPLEENIPAYKSGGGSELESSRCDTGDAYAPSLEESAPTATEPKPSVLAPAPARVLFVAHTGYFAGDTFGGATRANLAMVRDMRRACGGEGMDLVALTQTPVPEALVFKLDGGKMGDLRWEGELPRPRQVDQTLRCGCGGDGL